MKKRVSWQDVAILILIIAVSCLIGKELIPERDETPVVVSQVSGGKVIGNWNIMAYQLERDGDVFKINDFDGEDYVIAGEVQVKIGESKKVEEKKEYK